MFLRLVVLLLLLVPLAARADLLGVELYARGEFAQASRVLREEMNNPMLSEKERARARTYLAASLYALGRVQEARQQLEELALLHPEARLERGFFPPPLVALAEEVRASVEAERRLAEEQAERERLAAEEEARRQREREAVLEPEETPSQAEASAPLRLRPEASGFMDLVGQRSWGLAAGVTVGGGMLEGSARVLFGESLGVELEAGLVFGSGALQPRVALRGTVVPGLEGGAGFGGGAVVGGRLALSPQLTALVDVGAGYFSVPAGYNNVVVMASAGLGFNLL